MSDQEAVATTTAAEVEPQRSGTRPAPPVTGRLGLLTGLSLVVGAVPLPLLPDRALLHVRGALAHETAARHGISLSSDARTALAVANSKDRARALLRKGVELLTRNLLRRVGPLGPLSAAVTAFEVFALGHLLERYLRDVRRPGTVRMLEPEAERLRRAIDESVLIAFYPSTKPQALLLKEGIEDLRDEFTRWIDAFLLGSAMLPSYLQRRLDAAFDEVLQRSPELRNG